MSQVEKYDGSRRPDEHQTVELCSLTLTTTRPEGDATVTVPRLGRLGRIAVLALPSVIVLGATGVTTGVAAAVQEQSIRAAVVDQVSGVASSLAALPEVQDAVASVVDTGAPGALADADGLASATASLQPIASLVEDASGVSYVVVTDDEGVRITHPDPAERGERVQTTIAPVLAGGRFVGTETGPSGPTLRAKVPIVDPDGRLIGVVAVGVLESTIAADRERALGALLPCSTGALVAAGLASVLLSVAIARRLRRADAVDAESRQMRRTTDALREQAHEFGTRLHVVRGLVAQGDDEDAMAYIDAVAPGLTSGGGAGSPRRGAVATATIEAIRAEFDASGTALELRVADDVVLDDEVLLVVANLCRNGVEAGATTVRCTVGTRARTVTITVEDDGDGIDPADAHRVLTRGWSSKEDDTGLGRGIGLAVVLRVATDRGGLGGGGALLGAGRRPARRRDGGDHVTAPVRVLVVDDDAGARALHTRWVASTEGFEVVGAAASGGAALASLEHGVDLVLLDMRLPDISGIEVLHRMHVAGAQGVDVLVVSSSRDQVTVRQALAAHPVGYLMKPFDRTALQVRLRAYAAERQVRDGSQRDVPMGQGDVDRLLSTGSVRVVAPGRAATAGPRDELPKGVSATTLDRVVAALDPAVARSVDEVAAATGTSRATARRYLDHLVATGAIDLAHRYGRRGRPQVLYRLAPAP